MKNKVIAIVGAVLCFALFLSGYFLGDYTRKLRTPEPTEKRDTVIIEKTVEAIAPDPVTTHPSAPVVLPAGSFEVLSDSTLVAQAEIKEYRDTLADGTRYTATVSGVSAKLESLQITYPSTVVTRTLTTTKPYEGWLLSVTSNNAVACSLKASLCSVNALEFSYNKGPFHLGLQGGVLVEKPFCQQGVSVQPYLGGRITIDIYKFSR